MLRYSLAASHSLFYRQVLLYFKNNIYVYRNDSRREIILVSSLISSVPHLVLAKVIILCRFLWAVSLLSLVGKHKIKNGYNDFHYVSYPSLKYGYKGITYLKHSPCLIRSKGTSINGDL